MLNGGTLDGSHLNVTSETVHPDAPESHEEHPGQDVPIEQSDKPRAGSTYHEIFSRVYPLLMAMAMAQSLQNI